MDAMYALRYEEDTSASEMKYEKVKRCPVSHPAHPHTMSHDSHLPWGDDYQSCCCYTCGRNDATCWDSFYNYFCPTCDVKFHGGCERRPREITHPYHLKHPLTLTYRHPQTGIMYSFIPESISSYDRTYKSVEVVLSKSDIIFDKCTWCGQDLKGDWFYRCSICTYCLDFSCSQTVPLLTIPNPKNHPHSLVFFPRPISTPCDACGLVNVLEPSYVCFQCNYMAHRSCIDLPRVIKITRHPHRLSYYPFGSPVISTCRICYKTVDIKYGQYSCKHENCFYVAHSKCATHVNVWDGEELEWQPEEVDENEDMAPFRKLGNGFIQHFCHIHPLKLKKHDGVEDTKKQCEACIFPIISNQFYHCEECNYSLHEVCAGLSRKLDHALHNHTLILDPSPLRYRISRSCSSCLRESTGFRYICSKEGCESGEDFWVDVPCISVPECFTHKSHEHPIFLSTSYNSKEKIPCKVCKEICWWSHLQCTICEVTMCYACATIPDEIHYRFDKHPLTLCYGENTDVMSWCEVCEKKLDTKEWFYECNKCCTTLHLECIFGSSYFIKPGPGFQVYHGKLRPFHNRSNTRQFCTQCHQRCQGSIYYEGYASSRSRLSGTFVFCSLKCKTAKMGLW